MRVKRKRWRVAALGGVCAGVALAGCADTRVTDPPRTATEQFMLTTAAARAVDQLSFEPLRGRRVFLDPAYFGAPEKEFVLGEVRARALLEGVRLTDKRNQAEVILEVRSGGVGIDRDDFLLGVPPLLLSSGEAQIGSPAGDTPIITPELAILKQRDQRGYGGVAFVAYWADTGEVIASSGPFVGRTRREDWWIFGSGPNTVGNIPPAESNR